MIAASNYTTFAPGAAADGAVLSEGSIKVFGIVAANTNSSAETVIIEEADGSTVIMRLQVPANNTIVMDIPFVADNGINVTTGATTTTTVFHSQIL